MENITLPKFKDYKIGTDPTTINFFKGLLTSEFLSEEGGYSSFYGDSIDNVKKDFQNLLGSVTKEAGSFDKVVKLDSVFEFLEKKEGKPNPIKGIENVQPNTLYPIKGSDDKSYVGIGWMDEEGGINFAVLPISLYGTEELGKDFGFIKDIKDGGVFVWGDSQFKDDEVF